MFRRCLTPFCILILLCMVSTYNSAPLGYRGALSFSNSLRLTRTVRSRVQQLMSQYKQQVFCGELFEYRDLKLSTLPAVTVSYQTWLHMQDAERLRLASHFLQTFWTHLERQWQQFERERDATKERREQRRDKQGRPQPTLSQSFVGLQIDLRDLMKNKSRALRVISVAVHLNICERCCPNPGAHQTSGPRPLKRWVSVRFQTNSGAVRMIYERNMDQRHVTEPKTGRRDPIKDRILTHVGFSRHRREFAHHRHQTRVSMQQIICVCDGWIPAGVLTTLHIL
ncbi:hypothetical protein ABG768_018403 [Culter alburnus]|uniref:Uncharacterized protein n=1 Tax=Culter alburnus TaxID=194366 RepID=A0AAW1YX11_CULAL